MKLQSVLPPRAMSRSVALQQLGSVCRCPQSTLLPKAIRRTLGWAATWSHRDVQELSEARHSPHLSSMTELAPSLTSYSTWESWPYSHARRWHGYGRDIPPTLLASYSKEMSWPCTSHLYSPLPTPLLTPTTLTPRQSRRAGPSGKGTGVLSGRTTQLPPRPRTTA